MYPCILKEKQKEKLLIMVLICTLIWLSTSRLCCDPHWRQLTYYLRQKNQPYNQKIIIIKIKKLLKIETLESNVNRKMIVHIPLVYFVIKYTTIISWCINCPPEVDKMYQLCRLNVMR